jgi:DNA-binding ferritin-like protein (Dps family)
MSTLDDVLGAAPRSWSTLKADLVRARRHYDVDDEERQTRSFHSNQLDSARIQLLDSLLRHIEPAVADEKALWDRIDRDLDTAKEARPRMALDQPRAWTP